MRNSINKNAIKDKLVTMTYIITLICFELAALSFFLEYGPNRIILMTIVLILTGLVHFIVFAAASFAIDMHKNKPFIKEYNQVMDAYSETDDAKKFLHDLSNMKNPPQTSQTANAFYFSMSTALYRNHRNDDALSCLDKIDTSNKQTQKAVDEQRKAIENNSN